MKILCKSIDWVIVNTKKETYIDCFGISPKNKRILCRTEYHPWFYIYKKDEDYVMDKINENYTWEGKSIKSNIKVECEDYKKYDIHGYHKKKVKLTKLTFNSMKQYWIVKKKCKDIQFFDDVDLILKFTTDYQLKYSDWIEFDVEEKLNIGKCKSYLTSNPQRYTSPLPQITPRILSFDIEVMSSIKGTFPNPIRKGDNVFMCGFVFDDGLNNQDNIVVLDKQSKKTKLYKEILKTNEIELLNEIFNVINELDPDIIIGYNIFKFDLKYIEGRLCGEEIPNISRYKEYNSDFDDKTWKSSARGTVEVKFIKSPGRIFMDLYPYIKSKYSLSDYKLNTVSKFFLDDVKDDVPPEKLFELYLEGSEKSMYIISKYCVQDCALPLNIFKKLNIWFDINEASNATYIKIFDVLTRGQGEKAFHLEYIQMCKNDYFFYPFKRQSENYVGAKVFMPRPNIYDNVICLDFASLYPSIMIRYNLCYTTLANEDISDDDCYIFEWDDETKNGITHCKTRFVKETIRKGLLPILLEDLLTKRRETKKLMETYVEGSLEYKIYDLMQLYFKISANSVYGNKGTKTSKTPCYEVAKTTTYIGRSSILKVAEMLQNKNNEHEIGKFVYGDTYKATKKSFCRVLYGDTDSVMIYLPSLNVDINLQNIFDVGIKISQYINRIFEKPMKLEFEKVFRKFLPLSKKIYSFVLMDKDDMKSKDIDKIKKVNISDIKNIKSKGSAQVKRGYTDYCKEIYAELMRYAFTTCNFEEMMYYVDTKMKDILSYSIPKEKLILSLEVKSGKCPTHHYQVFIREMRELGFKLEDNERIKYIYIDTQKYHKKYIKIRQLKKKDKLGNNCIQISFDKKLAAVGKSMFLYDKFVHYKKRHKYRKRLYVNNYRYFTGEISKQVDKIFGALFNDYVPKYMEKIKTSLIKTKIKYLEELKYSFKDGKCILLKHIKRKKKHKK